MLKPKFLRQKEKKVLSIGFYTNLSGINLKVAKYFFNFGIFFLDSNISKSEVIFFG
jgi:hypothetical protein